MSAAQTAINNVTAQTGVRASIDSTGANPRLVLYSTNYGSGNQITATSNTAAANSVLGTPTANNDGTNIQGAIAGVAASGVGNVLTASSGSGAGLRVTFASQASGDTYTSATNNPFTSDATATTVTVDASKALVFQIGANQGQTAQIAMSDARASALGQGASGTFANLASINVVGTSAQIAESIKVVDAAISDVSNLRGQLGAFQANTLESNANNLRATMENTVSAESVVRDTDFAEEMAMFTKSQVMMQAGQTVLSNANQFPQMVAALLRG
jgi:flagellin